MRYLDCDNSNEMPRRNPLFYLGSNTISLAGVVCVTTAGILWLILLPSWWRGELSNPYLGILANLLLPVLLLLGLALIPLGIWLYTRKRRAAPDSGPLLPRGGELRKLAIFFGLTTFVNLLIGSQLMTSAVSYMDSAQFCGEACHTVMQPEYTAYSHSNHSKVACTDCHIGDGAPSFVRAKINGTRQLFAVAFHTYETPVPAPVEALRPARDICEHCHSQPFIGDKLVVRTHYSDDEPNSSSTTVALMRVGGQTWQGPAGIHGAHSSLKGRIDFISTDGHRQLIPEVRYTSSNGQVTVYKSTEAKVTQEQLDRGEHRTMDCMDCHNRPAHSFESPESAVDKAMVTGQISTTLPFIKKQAIAALRVSYPDRDTAARQIPETLNSYYKARYPQADPASLKTSIEAIQSIYALNIFPEMKVTWGTYPNNIGHTEAPGCFRCHDGNHTSASGKTISNDCATCHDLLAMDEKDPKILKDLGMNVSLVSTGGTTQ
jgi:nitrate/TMAO reductase-like tetraheme cytochrome c subunit